MTTPPSETALLPVSTDTAVPSEASEQQQQARAWDAAHVMKTYARQPVTFVRGQGARLWDADGREYLDFLAGIAVCAVGHCHPRLVRAIQEQAATLMHVSNLYLTQEQARLARRLVELSDFERVFFCNSGAEANEAAIKIARKRAKQIAKYPWFEHKKAWQKEIELMLKNGFKLEVEALISKDISYVTETYVPERLEEEDFLD